MIANMGLMSRPHLIHCCGFSVSPRGPLVGLIARVGCSALPLLSVMVVRTHRPRSCDQMGASVFRRKSGSLEEERVSVQEVDDGRHVLVDQLVFGDSVEEVKNVGSEVSLVAGMRSCIPGGGPR